MNWHKYSLDDWLIQYGAWCETCRMKTGHIPDSLRENMIHRLMVENGFKSPTYKNTVACQISDDEALEVNDLILSVFKRSDGEIRQAVKFLFLHRVYGVSLRKIADIFDINRIDLNMKLHLARGYILGNYGFLKT